MVAPDQQVRRDMSGMTLFRHRSTVPFHLPAHTHSVPIATFVLEGQTLECDADGGKEVCGKGSLIVTPPDLEHAHTSVTNVVTSLCVGPTLEFFTLTGSTDLWKSTRFFAGREVEKFGRRLDEESRASDEASTMIMQGISLELFGYLSRWKPVSETSVPAWLKRAKACLESEACGNWTIQEIADEVAIHPAHLCRAFRAKYNLSPGEYMRKVRLERAANLLSRTEESMKVIASRVGFTDPAHFSREFKKAYGRTPRAYRMMQQ